MNQKILFIIYNGEIKFLQNSPMDHREWYQSLGGNMEEYDNVIRGYIIDNMIIFFKANLNYDNEVIALATKMGLKMKQQLNRPDMRICCGINPGQNGEKWEPIMEIKDEELEGYKSEEEIEKEKQKEMQKAQLAALKDPNATPIVEFKNNYEDPKFTKSATIFTIVMLGIALISKAIMIQNKTMMMSNRWNFILFVVQIGSYILSIVFYNKKNPKAKVFAVISAVSSIVIFALADVVIGILTLLFAMDYTIFIKATDSLKSITKNMTNKNKNTE